MARFYAQENGAGGWEVRDRRDAHRVVSYSSFETFARKAEGRLNGTGDNTQDWFAFYGVRAPTLVGEG